VLDLNAEQRHVLLEMPEMPGMGAKRMDMPAMEAEARTTDSIDPTAFTYRPC